MLISHFGLTIMSDAKCCEGTSDPLQDQSLINISPAVKKCIKRLTHEEGFVSHNVDVKDILTNGGNYFATLQAIEIKGKTKYGDKEINIFVKNRIVTSQFDLVPFDEVYKREAFFYNELNKIYESMQEEANVPVGERLRVATSYQESDLDVTVLENLCKKAFNTCHRLDSISVQFAEMSIKQLAKLHSLSHVLQKNKPEYFDKNIKPLKTLMKFDSDFESYMGNLCDSAASCLDADYKVRLERFKPVMLEKYKSFDKTSEMFATCLCHGDFRANNIMINEKNGDIKDLIAVDYQLIYYGCPVFDFIYFIFTGSDQQFRRNHLDRLKALYYDTFKNFLKYFDIKAGDVYPRKRFEEEYKEHLDFGISSFLNLVPFLFCSNEEIPDLKSGMSSIKMNFSSDVCKERLRGVVDDFIEWGYL